MILFILFWGVVNEFNTDFFQVLEQFFANKIEPKGTSTLSIPVFWIIVAILLFFGIRVVYKSYTVFRKLYNVFNYSFQLPQMVVFTDITHELFTVQFLLGYSDFIH